MNRPTTRPVSRGNAARVADRHPDRCVAAAVSRGIGFTAGALVALYGLTVIGVWGVAALVDLRHDTHPQPQAQPKE